MKKERLQPFSIAGVLSYCPECGATGDYALLKRRAEAVVKAWCRLPKPDDSRLLTEMDEAVRGMEAAFNMEPKR